MEIKDRIRQKAHTLFLQYGIRSMSMDDIAASLGMSKKTIYQYYADKDELVDAVVDDELAHTQTDCEHCKTAARDAVEEMVLTMVQIYDQFRNMNPVVIFDLEKFHPRAHQKFNKHKNEFLLKVIRQNIERGIREELYRPELNVDVLSRYRLESMLIPFNMLAFPPSRYNLADVTQEIMEHFLYGLATPKGYKLIVKYKSDIQARKGLQEVTALQFPGRR